MSESDAHPPSDRAEPVDSSVELARVVSEGLAQLVAHWLRETRYTDVTIR